MGDATGDSVAVSGNASGAGGDVVIDLGEDGGTIAIGDHSASGGTAVGSGNDLLFGDNIDQNTRSVPGVGGIDSIDGEPGTTSSGAAPTPISSTATPVGTTATASRGPTWRSTARSDRPGIR
ncbi:hypothetical protein [Streptomyces mirabilis]